MAKKKTVRPRPRPTRRDHIETADVLWIQMAGAQVLNDALGRYVNHPPNLPKIQAAFCAFLEDLGRISPPGGFKDRCPDGFSHRDCACVPDICRPPLK